MTEIVTFLRARLDDDERAAQWRLNDHTQLGAFELDPGQALRDVEAKRRLIARCEQAHHEQGIWGEDGQQQLAEETLELLALPYSDDPDYDESWKP